MSVVFSEISQKLEYECPNCGKMFPSEQPRPGCNECQCCFCSEACRDDYHSTGPGHTYDLPLEE